MNDKTEREFATVMFGIGETDTEYSMSMFMVDASKRVVKDKDVKQTALFLCLLDIVEQVTREYLPKHLPEEMLMKAFEPFIRSGIAHGKSITVSMPESEVEG